MLIGDFGISALSEENMSAYINLGVSHPEFIKCNKPSQEKRKQKPNPSPAPSAEGFNEAALQSLGALLTAMTVTHVARGDSSPEEQQIAQKMAELRDLLVTVKGRAASAQANPQDFLAAFMALHQGQSFAPSSSPSSSPSSPSSSSSLPSSSAAAAPAPAPVMAPPPPPPPPAPPAPPAPPRVADIVTAPTIPIEGQESEAESQQVITTPIDQIENRTPSKGKKGSEPRNLSKDSLKTPRRTHLGQIDGNEGNTMSITQIIGSGGGASALKKTKQERSPGGTPKKVKKAEDDLLTQALKKKFENAMLTPSPKKPSPSDAAPLLPTNHEDHELWNPVVFD